ncbi:unnamed protein product [Macrosiphum euphorbiae]|uniref:Uncharacterized protein n=1 Tax=Macrosiphum euphorbiae TaxID=13131 RepID=A0AAV0XS41_9HEMI|nr:unnamed protein product [Macrosiphum euphorbiae]
MISYPPTRCQAVTGHTQYIRTSGARCVTENVGGSFTGNLYATVAGTTNGCYRYRFGWRTRPTTPCCTGRDGKWYYADYKNRTLFSCDYKIRPPDSIATPPLRPCVGEGSAEGIVDGRPVGTPTAMALACASHTYTIFEYPSSDGNNIRVFRNVDCARCNGLTINQLMCDTA